MAYEEEEGDGDGYSVSEAGGFRLGDLATWDGGEGRIEHLMADGSLGLEGGPFSIPASKEYPAALLRVYRNGQPTEYLVGKRVADLTKGGGGVRLGRNGRR
jgi:hypothetical protein